MFFIQADAETVADALAAWSWLELGDKTPFAVTALGDVFLDADSGVWFLDRIEGKLERAADNLAALEQLLDTEEGQDHYLWYTLVEAAADADLAPDDEHCLDFITPPILGGETSVDNLALRNVATVLRAAGELHERIKDLPEGALVEQIPTGE